MAGTAAVQRDDGSYLVSGWMPVNEFAELLSMPLPEIRSYETVAGFVLHDFGKLPEVGSSFERDGWCFEVMDMDGRRIDKIVAAPCRRRSTS